MALEINSDVEKVADEINLYVEEHFSQSPLESGDSFGFSPKQKFYDLAEMANEFYVKVNGDGTKVADVLTQNNKEFMVNTALRCHLFSAFSYNGRHSEVDVSGEGAYGAIKSHCGISDGGRYDGYVFLYELFDYLGFMDSKDTETYRNIMKNIQINVLNCIDQLQTEYSNGLFNSSVKESNDKDLEKLNHFFASSVPASFSGKQKKKIFEKYLEMQNALIESRGFSKDIIAYLDNFEKKMGSLFENQKDELYDSARKSLRQEIEKSRLSSFFTDFMNVYEYFSKMPKKPQSLLGDYIVKILSGKSIDSEDVTNLLIAQEAYRRISGKKGDNGFVDFLGFATGDAGFDEILEKIYDYGKPKKGEGKYLTSKGGIDLKKMMVEMAFSIMNDSELQSTDDNSLKKYIKIYELVLGNDNIGDSLAKAVVASIGKTRDEKNGVIYLDKNNRTMDYIVCWDDIGLNVNNMKNVFGIDLTGDIKSGNMKLVGDMMKFQNSARERISEELKRGNVEGLEFWRDVVEGKSFDSFSSVFMGYYKSARRNSLSNGDLSSFSDLARKYNTVFGKYPEEFSGRFQNLILNMINRFESGYNGQKAIDITSIMYDLSVDEMKMMPQLQQKILQLNESDPEKYGDLIPDEHLAVSC